MRPASVGEDVAMVQLTLIQLDNYGPWTVTPEPRPEYDIQALQARLYADLSSRFGVHDAVTFFARFDNVIAVTDGVDADAHRAIQRSIGNAYPVTVSMGVASAASPVEAVERATAALQAEGSAQDDERRERLAVDSTGRDAIEVAHFDVNDATDRMTDRLDAFTSMARIHDVYGALMHDLRERHGALTFFVGGDNAISVTPGLDDAAYRDALDAVRDATGAELKVGVGSGERPSEASMHAKTALERCRHDDVPVARAGQTP